MGVSTSGHTGKCREEAVNGKGPRKVLSPSKAAASPSRQPPSPAPKPQPPVKSSLLVSMDLNGGKMHLYSLKDSISFKCV